MFNFSLHGLLESNLFNSLILFALIVFLAWKLDAAGMLIAAKETVENILNQSDIKKSDSEKTLSDMKKEVENLPQELAKIANDAKNTVEGYKIKTSEEIKETVTRLEANAEKIIQNEVQKLSSALRKELSRDSLNRAQEKIAGNLSDNSDLHRKFIADAIDKIEGINI